MTTKPGMKLLDFRLAKLKGEVVPAFTFLQMAAADPSQPLTAKGNILGTLQSTAPEQLRQLHYE